MTINRNGNFKMLKKTCISILIFLGFASQVSAADNNSRPVNLSLQESINLALKNNLELRIESYTPEIRELDLQKIYDEFGFSVGLRPNFQNNIRPTANSFISGSDVLREFNQRYDLFARQRLMTNGEVALEMQNSINNTNSTRVDINPAITPGLALNITQPLLKNFLNGYRRVEVGKNETIASNLRLKNSAIDIVARVQDAYWNLVLAQERLKVLQDSLNLARELLKINQEKEKAGVMAMLEVLRTEASIAAREESLLQGQRAVGESEDALKRLLNPNASQLDWEQKINTTERPVVKNINASFNESYNKAVNNRPDYLALLVDDDTLAILTEIAKQNRLPNLTFNGSLGLNALDGNYLTALKELFSLETYSWNIGFNFEIPVKGNVDETEYRQTLLELERQKLTLENYRQQMLNEVRNSIRNVEINKKRVEANELSRKLLTEQVKAEMEKLNLGLSTNFQVLELQQDLIETSLNEVNSRVEYVKSVNNLSAVEGDLLEENRIYWDDTAIRQVVGEENK